MTDANADEGSQGTELQVTDDGKAFRVKPDTTEYEGPSLSGPVPTYGYQGQRGLGGSVVNPTSVPDNLAQGPGAVVQDAYKPVQTPLTPAQMMAMADQYEAKIQNEHEGRMAQGPAVNPVADNGGASIYIPGPTPPTWLDQYMDNPPSVPEVQSPGYRGPSGTTVYDRVGGQKYIADAERLRKLKKLTQKK